MLVAACGRVESNPDAGCDCGNASPVDALTPPFEAGQTESGACDRSDVLRWPRILSASGDQFLTALSVGRDDGVWVSGQYDEEGRIELGSCENGLEGDGTFLLKLDGAGGTVRSARVGSSIGTSVGVAIGADGAVYVPAIFAGQFELFGETRAGPDALAARLAPNGEPQWLRTFGHPDGNVASVTMSDGVFLAGRYEGAVDFGPAGVLRQPPRPVGAAKPFSLFVAKLTVDGAPVWARSFTAPPSLEARNVQVTAIASDGAGGAIVKGGHEGDPDATRPPGCDNVPRSFLMRFDNRGDCLWAIDPEGALPMVVDSHGDIFIGGGPTGTPFGVSGLTKYDGQGNLAWSRSFELPGGRGLPTPATLKLNRAQDRLVMTAAARDAIANRALGGFVAILDTEGSLLWSEMIAGSAFINIYADFTSADEVIVGVNYQDGDVSMSDVSLDATPEDGFEFFVTKISPP